MLACVGGFRLTSFGAIPSEVPGYIPGPLRGYRQQLQNPVTLSACRYVYDCSLMTVAHAVAKNERENLSNDAGRKLLGEQKVRRQSLVNSATLSIRLGRSSFS
jgi:hypothetical protein